MNLSRSQPPAIPANFLSRKHLYSLFESHVPGATLVIAPTGFGKTMLVAEWAQASGRPVFWYTVDEADTMQDFQAHVIASVTSYFPHFFDGVEQIEHFEPGQSIKLLANAIGKLSGEFNFVIDTGRTENYEIAAFAQFIIDSVPNNSHLVIIRRNMPLTSFARYASTGNLSLITSEDLKFSQNEVEIIATINNVDLEHNGNAKELAKCQGWPAAIQLMCRNIQKGNTQATFSAAMAASTNPLGVLAIETYNTLSESSRTKILRLSIIEEFDLEIALVILDQDFSEQFLNRLATDGIFVTASSTSNRTYRFNPIVFEALTQIPQESSTNIKEIYRNLVRVFRLRQDLTKALNYAYLGEDWDAFSEIFSSSIRHMAAIGRGDLLIKWAHFAGDDSSHGEIMKKTIKVVGHLVKSDFLNAEALASELEYVAGLNPENVLLSRLSAMVKANVYFARGDFERAGLSLDIAISKLENSDSLDSTDLLSLLRLRARKAFLHDEFADLAQAFIDAKTLADDGEKRFISYQLNCIRSMVLYAEGRYFQAAETSQMAITQAGDAGYVGINGPLDAMMVLARTQLEASNLHGCIVTLNEIMIQAKEWEIWPWFFMAEGTLIRIQISQGSLAVASESITKQRELLKTMHTPNQMGWLVDMSEIFLRLTTSDWRRAQVLAARMPEIELVRQIKTSIEHEYEPKKVLATIAALPENTVREKINKSMTEAGVNIDNENLALKSLRKALDLGAENGYHEYFIRQTAMYPLIVKAAAAKPTIYMERLVQAMTARIHTINSEKREIGEKLTQREFEILKHLTTGNPISVIAKNLHISQNTMKTHLRNMYRKLDADGRYSAVEKAKKLLLI